MPCWGYLYADGEMACDERCRRLDAVTLRDCGNPDRVPTLSSATDSATARFVGRRIEIREAGDRREEYSGERVRESVLVCRATINCSKEVSSKHEQGMLALE